MGGSEDYDTPKSREGSVEVFFNLGDKGLILYRLGIALEHLPALGTATREERNEIAVRHFSYPSSWMITIGYGRAKSLIFSLSIRSDWCRNKFKTP